MADIMFLMRTLFDLDYNDFGNMNRYVIKSPSFAQKLTDIVNPVEDNLLAVILLAGLPPEYKPMVTAIDSFDMPITTELVKSKLLQEGIRVQL